MSAKSREGGEGFPGPPEWTCPGMSRSRPVAVGQRSTGEPDSDPIGQIIDERSRVCIINNRREVMRTLTMNEVEEVGGGPAPVAVVWAGRILIAAVAIAATAYIEQRASNLADEHDGKGGCPAPN